MSPPQGGEGGARRAEVLPGGSMLILSSTWEALGSILRNNQQQSLLKLCSLKDVANP